MHRVSRSDPTVRRARWGKGLRWKDLLFGGGCGSLVFLLTWSSVPCWRISGLVGAMKTFYGTWLGEAAQRCLEREGPKGIETAARQLDFPVSSGGLAVRGFLREHSHRKVVIGIVHALAANSSDLRLRARLSYVLAEDLGDVRGAKELYALTTMAPDANLRLLWISWLDHLFRGDDGAQAAISAYAASPKSLLLESSIEEWFRRKCHRRG